MLNKHIGLAIAGSALLAVTATAQNPVINEVYYDAPGSDGGQVFVEIYGPGGADIGDWTLQSVEMRGGSAGLCNNETFTFPTGYTIPTDGFVVLADDDGTGATAVLNADFIVGDMDLENGGDGLVLCDNNGVLVDSVNYGSIDVTVFGACACAAGMPVEGAPARDVFAPLSIERCPAGADTNDNDTDFTPNTPTPGTGEASCAAVEFVTGTGPLVGGIPTLSLGTGDSVGFDMWISGSAGQVYLLLWSFTGSANGSIPPVVVDASTGIAAGLANIPPFIAWAGVLDGNGRTIGAASMDWSGLGAVLPVVGPVPTWVGGVSLDPSLGLVGSGNAVQIDITN